MHQNILDRPGCYGSPLCYNDKSAICGRCNLTVQCAADALARADRLRRDYDIRVLTSKPGQQRAQPDKPARSEPTRSSSDRAIPISADPVFDHGMEQLFQALKKAALGALRKRAIQWAQIGKGFNPIHYSVDSPTHLAIDLLLKDACSREKLQAAISENMKVSTKLAITYTRLSMEILIQFAVAKWDHGADCLKRVS